MKHFTAVDRQRLLMKIERMVDTGLNGTVYRVRSFVGPVVTLTRISKLDAGDVFYIFVPVLVGSDQTEREPVVLAQWLTVHTQYHKDAWARELFQGEALIVRIRRLMCLYLKHFFIPIEAIIKPV